jgi:hypothetical protein
MTTAGWVGIPGTASCPASAVDALRYSGDDGQYACRAPNSRRVPRASTREASGYVRRNHAGGEAVRREVDADSGGVQLFDDPDEPVELVPAFLGLEVRPREDADGHQVDAGLLHEGATSSETVSAGHCSGL